MQRELKFQGNKYEIMDFVKSRLRMSIGLQRAPKPVSVLENVEEETEEVNHENDEDDDKDSSVEELPKKVDEFMNYINRVYFDGNLDQDGKQMFRNDLETVENKEESVDIEEHTIETLLNARRRRKILITS